MKKLILLLLFGANYIAYSQVGIGTTSPNSSAILDLNSINKSLLLPRLNSVQMTAVLSPAAGMVIYNTDSSCVCQYNGTSWLSLCNSYSLYKNGDTLFLNDQFVLLDTQALGWLVRGNAGTDSSIHFIGTTDDAPLTFRVNDVIKVRLKTNGTIETLNTGESVFIGERAGSSDDLSSNKNNFIGYYAGDSNITGTNNIAIGYASLMKNRTGHYNTAVGNRSLLNNRGNNNTALGSFTLNLNTSGNNNLGAGWSALLTNTIGNDNVALGYSALLANTLGSNNTAAGSYALNKNVAGENNSAFGKSALRTNLTGSANTAIGESSAYLNTVGIGNSSLGYYSLRTNTTGNRNGPLGAMPWLPTPLEIII